MSKLERVIAVLHAAGFEPTPEELADALWLAQRIAVLEGSTGKPSALSARGERELISPEKRPQPQRTKTREALPRQRPRAEPRVTLHPYSRLRRQPGLPTGGVKATPFRAPAVPMLSEALQLGRALKPIKRRVPSRVQVTLDETDTVQRIAEQALWVPVFRPKPERWLEVALVVDGYSSMVIWEPMLNELRRLLERSGACRDVRVWRLIAEPTNGARRLRLTDESGHRARHARELLDSTGRRLIWVLSDCVAPYWRDNRALFDLLRLWSRHNPLALVQMLPQRFWPLSGLAGAQPINLRAGGPGSLNARLRSDEPCPPASLKLPVVTLEPESLEFWANMLAGRGTVWSAGVALTRHESAQSTGDEREPVVQAPAPSGLERLEDFMATASPEAQQLASLFSTVPLTLPIMRLVQQVMLPQSRLVHLAEVFLSGLLGRADRDLDEKERETDPLRIPFDFLPDIRELLLDSLPVSEVERTARRVAVAIEQRLGQASDFLALLADPAVPGRFPLQAQSLPFARIRVTVLRRLGGAYSGQAEELAEEIHRFEEGRVPGVEESLEPTKPTLFRDRFLDGRAEAPEMIWLPGGTFTMGDNKSGRDNEKPAHEVTLSAFSIGQYPVTFEEYDKFCEATGREAPSDSEWGRGKRPVMRVSYEDAAAYCEWLYEQTGERYRLLTEAEWEYACRAGSDTAYCFGDDEQRLGDYAWYSKNAGGKTHPVGEKLPNDWGLYDMYGNVWEWVRDWYGDYSSEPQSNPSGPESGSGRVFRGGGWLHDAVYCRSAYRNYWLPEYRNYYLGFRLARDGAWPSYPFTLEPEKTAETPVETATEAERKKGYKPYEVFQDGPDAPEMVYLPGGTFRMGDSQGKGTDDERPVHEVTLDAFAIGRYPVTVGDFRRFVEEAGYKTEAEREDGAYVFDGKEWGKKSDASWRNPYFSQEENHPVVCISWNDAAAYCEWLSEQTGERYELPTEAEWEYACRAASDTAYCFGDDEQKLEEYAWYSKNARGMTRPVGEKLANDWGLYDMHGNVFEWVRDWYERYSSEPQSNPSGPESGSNRVHRGGGWDSDADNCRSAYRRDWPPGYRYDYLGFRLARRV